MARAEVVGAVAWAGRVAALGVGWVAAATEAARVAVAKGAAKEAEVAAVVREGVRAVAARVEALEVVKVVVVAAA